MDGEETEARPPDNESLSSDSGASTEPHEKVRTFPTTPGVYLMKDAQGRVIYVGKALNLRSRAGSYFTKAAEVELRTAKKQKQGRRKMNRCLRIPALQLSRMKRFARFPQRRACI